MVQRTRPARVTDGLLDALVRSGRRLLGAEWMAVAAGPTGRLVIRAVTGTAGGLSTGSRLTEEIVLPSGVLTSAGLSGVAQSPTIIGTDGSDVRVLARQPDQALRVLLIAASADPPDEAEMQHLAEMAAAVLAAERQAALGTIRNSLREREDERRRWARELHDETLQQLGALQVLLTSVLPQFEAGPGRSGRSDLGDAVRLATELVAGQIGSLRQLITELRPPGLDDLGLTPPLQALARRTEELSGIRVTLHASLRYADGVVRTRLLPDIELAIYRVVQEALTNVRRHSGGTRAAVTVIEDDEVVVVEVRDDGRGFGADQAAGFGVEGMRERAELAGGTLELGPARPDGSGTTVRLVVPATHRGPA